LRGSCTGDVPPSLTREDAWDFGRYVEEKLTEQPVDILWKDYVVPSKRRKIESTRGREIHVYRYILFSHAGDVSSFPNRPKRKKWPSCNENMSRVWSLEAFERYLPRCAKQNVDLSPCPGVVPK